MAHIETTFDVTPPVSDVYSYLADPTHLTEWDRTVASIVATTSGADEAPADAWYELEAAFYGKRIPFTLRCIEHEDNALLVFRGTHSSARLEERFALEPTETGGTRVTYRSEAKLTGLLRVLNKGLDSAYAGAKRQAAVGLAAVLAGPSA